MTEHDDLFHTDILEFLCFKFRFKHKSNLVCLDTDSKVHFPVNTINFPVYTVRLCVSAVNVCWQGAAGVCVPHLAEERGLQLSRGVAGVKKLTERHLQKKKPTWSWINLMRKATLGNDNMSHRWRNSLVSDPEDSSYQTNVSENHQRRQRSWNKRKTFIKYN